MIISIMLVHVHNATELFHSLALLSLHLLNVISAMEGNFFLILFTKLHLKV